MPPRIRLVMRQLEREGWLVDRTGAHVIYVHANRPGVSIALPNHPAKDISPGVYSETRKKAGWT